MSFKAKDLHFERQEPAFLKRFKAGISDATGDPDRQSNPVPFQKKPKRLEADDEDEPTYVIENSTETLTKDEYEKLVQKSKDSVKEDKPPKEVVDDGPANHSTASEQQPPQTAAMRKRKAIKVVGGENTEEAEKRPAKRPATTQLRKKAKVKLSFGDDEEG